jgi:hypothetical protein
VFLLEVVKPFGLEYFVSGKNDEYGSDPLDGVYTSDDGEVGWKVVEYSSWSL